MVEFDSDSSAFICECKVKELLKSVNTFRSYHKNKVGRFFETQCRISSKVMWRINIPRSGKEHFVSSNCELYNNNTLYGRISLYYFHTRVTFNLPMTETVDKKTVH